MSDFACSHHGLTVGVGAGLVSSARESYVRSSVCDCQGVNNVATLQPLYVDSPFDFGRSASCAYKDVAQSWQ